ncbi:MAG TPA: purine-binding chemotaxis protein CheW [Bacteroidetes bacterium]|nr:purine-binding chemotaxis protein CheW [Bacteroidota bacterium]
MRKYLTFSLGSEEYGIEIRDITEIIGIQNITDLPGVPNYVKGVINLRGKVIPVMDLRLRFMIEEKEYDERTCIIVVNVKGMAVGLIVDSVTEVLDISAKDIEPPPIVNQSGVSRYILGLGKAGDEVKIILDTQELLFGEELDLIAEAASANAEA